jgi:hypothetical protein
MGLPSTELEVRLGAPAGSSHVHHGIDRQVRCSALPRQHRHAYAAGFRRGLPTDTWNRLRSRPPASGGRALRPAQIRQVRAGVVITGRQALIPRVHLPVSLAGPGPSGSASPSRRCQGCLPLGSASPEPNCPQLQPNCCDNPAVKVSHLTRFHSASWRTHELRQARVRLPPDRHRCRDLTVAQDVIGRAEFRATAVPPRRCPRHWC